MGMKEKWEVADGNEGKAERRRKNTHFVK